MFTKQRLITDIENYTPFDDLEAVHKQAMLELLNGTDHCFLRSDFPGHMVGGVWLLSPDGNQVLLTHHKVLNKWFQFGGHADGEIDIAKVALREAQEESGIADIELVPGIFDIDVHEIPANPKKGEKAHTHYELRYLARAKHKDAVISDESTDLKWFDAATLKTMNFGASRLRLIEKWQKLV